MKVLHVITTLQRGGAEKQLVWQAGLQRAAGLDVDVAWLKGEPELLDELRHSRVPCHDLGLRRYGDPLALLRLRRLLRTLQPDVVHAHLPPAELYVRAALTALPLTPPAFVITRHNVSPFCPGFAAVILSRWCLERAGRVICPSKVVLDKVLAEAGEEIEPRLRLQPYGVPVYAPHADDRPDFRQSWRTLSGRALDNAELVLGCAARFVPQKAHERLLAALAAWRDAGGRPVTLVLAGRGPLRERTMRQAVRLGLADAVVDAGFVPDMAGFMSALDVYVSGAAWEGFGLSVLEAMSHGLPVLVSDIGPHREMVVNGSTGFLFGPEPESFVRALQGLMDAEERTRLGQAGRGRARALYGLERAVRGGLMIYADALGIDFVQQNALCRMG